MFQLTAARRRLENGLLAPVYDGVFQLTAARRRLVNAEIIPNQPIPVSTHSRPKAAGNLLASALLESCRFNSQPPEGGWLSVFH